MVKKMCGGKGRKKKRGGGGGGGQEEEGSTVLKVGYLVSAKLSLFSLCSNSGRETFIQKNRFALK